MQFLFSKVSRIIAGIISGIIQVSNMFLGNIIIYESTEKIKFDWYALLSNRLFWIVVIVTVIYYSIPLIIKQNEAVKDEALDKAISDSLVKIVDLVAKNAKQGNYESCDKLLNVLDKLKKRGRK